MAERTFAPLRYERKNAQHIARGKEAFALYTSRTKYGKDYSEYRNL